MFLERRPEENAENCEVLVVIYIVNGLPKLQVTFHN